MLTPSSSIASTWSSLADAQKWVVKIGSAPLSSTSGVSNRVIERLCRQIADLVANGRQVVLVSSGAIAAGSRVLGFHERPTSLHELQAAAAVGQVALTMAYERQLAKHHRHTAMHLLTHDDLSNRLRYLNARTTFESLLKRGIVPIVNENDTVATEEIRFGDNDTLAARVASLISADVLVLLTDQSGLHERDPRDDPHAPLIAQRPASAPDLTGMASKKPGQFGRGGMISKIQAARFAAASGCHTVIADGRTDDDLLAISRGQPRGTLLTADVKPAVARKRWIAGQLKTKGSIRLDSGAVVALRQKGVSVLAVGVDQVYGEFQRGDLVRVVDTNEREVARGLINYSAAETQTIKRRSSDEIEGLLGYIDEPELIHRDNLTLV